MKHEFICNECKVIKSINGFKEEICEKKCNNFNIRNISLISSQYVLVNRKNIHFFIEKNSFNHLKFIHAKVFKINIYTNSIADYF